MTIASLSFALSGVAVHALGEESWDVALLARAIFGLPFAIVAFLSGSKGGQWGNPRVLARNLSAVIYLAALYFALERISPGNSFTLASMRPLWVAGIYLVVGRSAVRWIFWPIVAIAAIGVGLMEGINFSAGYWIIIIAVVVGLFGALTTIAIDFCKGHDPEFMALHLNITMLVVAVSLVGIRSDASEMVTWLNPASLGLFLVVGLGGTLYQLFNFRAVRMVGAETGSTMALMATVFAWLIGHFVWRASSPLMGIIGLLMALLPCVWIIFFGGFSRRREENAEAATCGPKSGPGGHIG